jgi:uncharacterized protein YneF (UPF0154 family)
MVACVWNTPVGPVLGLAAFLVMGISVFLYGSRRKRIAQECSPLADIYPVLNQVKPFIRVLEVFLGIALVCGFLIGAFFFNKDIYDTDYTIPIIAPREHYYLTSHGTLTDVSQLEFILDAVSFQVGWFSGVWLATLYMLKKLFYGEPVNRPADTSGMQSNRD